MSSRDPLFASKLIIRLRRHLASLRRGFCICTGFFFQAQLLREMVGVGAAFDCKKQYAWRRTRIKNSHFGAFVVKSAGVGATVSSGLRGKNKGNYRFNNPASETQMKRKFCRVLCRTKRFLCCGISCFFASFFCASHDSIPPRFFCC